MLQRCIGCHGDLLTHHAAHASPDEPEVHAGDHRLVLVQLAIGSTDSILQAAIGLALLQAVGVLLGVLEFQRISGHQLGPDLSELVVVEEDGEVLLATDLLVVTALRAHPQGVLMIIAGHDLRALRALVPQTLGSFLLLLGGGGDAFLDACEPAHGANVLNRKTAER